MTYSDIIPIAERLKGELAPHCYRIEIAGSIRRKKSECKDIELVAIPKPYDTGLFESGLATVVNKWQKVKGELPCRYTQRLLPEGVKLDLFFASPENWGLIFALRTGSADFSHKVLAGTWVGLGYHSAGGMLRRQGREVAVHEEEDLFSMLHLAWVSPEERW